MDKYKGIIFDLDGTLLDTINDLGDSMNEALSILGWPTFELEEYKLKIGGGFRGLATNCLSEDVGEDVITRTMDLFAEIYDKNFLNKTVPYGGIDELLDKLNNKGILLAVNSNKNDQYTKVLIDKFFSRIPFVNVYGEREGLAKKPEPHAAVEILSEMRLSKDEVLFIGDSRTDIETANNVGMDSVGVLWGFRGREELMKHGATYIVEKPVEILRFV